jgi:methyl-accepting chemotaxis protein
MATVRLRITLASVLGAFVLSGMAVLYSASFFRSAVTELNRKDYRDRIRNAELDYGSVEAVSGASETEQQDRVTVLELLNRRYSHVSDSAVPFIINGDSEIIFFKEHDGLHEDFFSPELVSRIIGTPTADFSAAYRGTSYWIIYSHFPTWDWYTGYILKNSERLAAVNAFSLRLTLALSGGALLIVFATVLILRRIISPIGTISAALKAAAEGNLGGTVAYARNDEIGEIAESYRALQARLTDIVSGIQYASERNVEAERTLDERTGNHMTVLSEIVDSTGLIRREITELDDSIRTFGDSTGSIHRVLETLDDRTSDQLAAVSESTASVEEMTAALANVSSIARTKRETTRLLVEKAEAGGAKLTETVEAIARIHANVDNISETVGMIRNIARQTNLLSMNAAIEAAHAGDAGRGFSVVADEIRKLSEESSANSGRIASIINDIVERIRNTDVLGRSARDAFAEIRTGIDEVSDSYSEISASTDQLSAGTGEILKAMSTLADVSGEVRSITTEANSEIAKAMEAIERIAAAAGAVVANIEQIDDRSRLSREAMEEVRAIVSDLKQIVESLSEQANFFAIGSGRGR